MNGTVEGILVMTSDPTVSAAVDAALGSNGRSWVRTSAQTLREAMFHLGRQSVPAAVVDLDPQPAEALAELDRLTARFPGTRFIALAAAIDQDLLLAAMQSGVRQVLLKQKIAAELTPVLYRLVAAPAPQAAERGDLFVVLSAGGGCGATTLAVNLADELAARRGSPALLIDLDSAYGTLATVLGVEPRYGVDHLLGYEGTIDTDLVRSTATAYGDRIRVLPGPAGTGLASDRMTFARLEPVLDAAAQAYRTVVVDAPRVPPDVAAVLVSAASRTLLAMQLTVKDVRVARSMLGALADRGVSPAAVVPVVNRYARRQHMVSLEDASQAVGGAALECLRSDYAAAARAMDFGQTLAAAAPRSPLRRDVQDLAAKVAAAAEAARGARVNESIQQ